MSVEDSLFILEIDKSRMIFRREPRQVAGFFICGMIVRFKYAHLFIIVINIDWFGFLGL